MNRPLRRVIFALLAASALVALAAGCSKTPSAPTTPVAPSSSAAETTQAAADTAAPTLKLVTPADGATVAAGDVKLVVETTGIKFTMPSTTRVEGEGHVHYTLDDQPVQMSAEPEYVYKGVTSGKHTLTAELVQNDTTEFQPPVKQTITFTAK